MLTKDYSRAVRILIMLKACLQAMILAESYSIPLYDNGEFDNLVLLADPVLSCLGNAVSTKDCDEVTESLIEMKNKLTDFRTSRTASPTAELWLQFIDMVDILCFSILAERTGNWSLHLYSIKEMIPFELAAGRHQYAQAGMYFLQEMGEIRSRNPEHYNQLSNGYFTVCTKDSSFGGRAADLTIEQELMRPAKSVGGVTHGV